jgi:hypothetical protein
MNGNHKSLLLLWENLASNQRYEPYVEEFDLRTFRRRFENEGLTFLTVVLPRIGKCLDRYHSTNEWTPPEGFELRKDVTVDPDLGFSFPTDSSKVPVFLGNAVEAALKGDSIAVDCVRQLTLIFYKLEVDYGEEMESQFLARFEQTDLDLLSLFDSVDFDRDVIVGEMGRIIARVLCNSDPYDIVPTHGSGATACRTPNWKKHHRALKYFEKLDNVYPYSDYFFFSYTHLADEYERLRGSDTESVPRARVCLVPKDSRGPRVISCEPAELMYIQQGIMRKLYETLEAHNLTSGRINFTDQTINQELARRSSKGELNLATIDLSDASDRVSLELVRRVFPPRWFECLDACRSEETELPNGKVVKLNKFAPMGSSCCFPVEALVFWACAVATLRISRGLKKYPDVYVYGDDIITDSDSVELVMMGLEKVGLKVNRDKSYFRGPFRESCGGDYHLGVDVTPVRVRKFLDKSSTSIVTNADLANLFIAKFGYAESYSLLQVIEEAEGYVFPRTDIDIPCSIKVLSPSASNDVFFKRKWNSTLQRFEHRILVCSSPCLERQPPNWEELLRKQLPKSILTRHHNGEELLSIDGPYSNPIAKLDRIAEPGWYTDPHTVVVKWAWTWLG